MLIDFEYDVRLFKFCYFACVVCKPSLVSQDPTTHISMLYDSYADLIASAALYSFFQERSQGVHSTHAHAPLTDASPEKKRRADDMDFDEMDTEGGKCDSKRSCGGC